ncbi:MAG: hypothetical protein JKX68_01290 [Flavobacteriales bacterium]|nr:hypothetical protein [Flavobacteriales bacterium]
MEHKLSIREGVSFEELQTEIENGGRFIIYQYCISIFFAITLNRLSPAIFILAKEDSTKFKSKYNSLSSIFGWWGLPWGPIHSIKSIRNNNQGGIDVTKDIMLNINKTSFESRVVTIEEMDTMFSKPSKSDLKEFTKVANKLKEGINIQELYVGLFINTDEYVEPYYMLAISGKSTFDTNSEEVKKALYTRFRKHVVFEYLNLSETDDITSKMIEQGVKLI